MRFLFLLLLIFGFQRIPGLGGKIPVSGNTMTTIHTMSGFGDCNSTASCPITIPSATSGSLAVLHVANTNGTNLVLSSVTGESGWVIPSGSTIVDASAGAISFGYNLSSTVATTALVLVFNATGNYHYTYTEIACSPGPCSLDNANTHANSSGTNTGPTLTLSGTNDAVFQAIVSGAGNPTAISGGYTGVFVSGAYAAGFAINQNPYVQPTWTGPTGANAVSTLAFK